MASPNLRLVANNLVLAPTTTISASSSVGLLVPANLKKTGRSLVHRAGGTSVSYTLSFGGSRRVGMVALPFTNCTENATIEVGSWPSFLDTSVDPPVQRFATSGVQQGARSDIGAPYGWEKPNGGVNSFAYGGGRYLVCWFGNVNVSSLTITINDPGNPDGYIEAAYMVAGEWWSPSINASYGAGASFEDTSKHDRSDAGDLITARGVVSKKLTLPFSDMGIEDRTQLWGLLKACGMNRAFFVSLFPENPDYNKSAQYQVYGKLATIGALTIPNYSQFATSLDVVEI